MLPMIRPWKVGAVLLLLLLAALLLASCDGGDDSDGVRGTPGGPITVEFWHSQQSPNEQAVQRIVDEFNASQSQYRVEAIFQGSYSESLNKLIASLPSGNIPALIQTADVSTQIMIDGGLTTPIQEFVDEEGYDLSDFDPKALAYYTVGDTLRAMPFNPSGPILIYDRQLFEDAGLDPDQPPRTFDEVRSFSEQLVRRNDQGEVTRYGIALQVSPSLFEQMLAKQNALYVNNGNGREGRATEAVFDSEEGKRIIQWWDEMVDEGLARSFAGTQSDLDALLALARRQAVMAIGSTAVLGAAVATLTEFGIPTDRFGTGFLPAPANDGGIIVGGGALWVVNERPEEEQRGAWEFLKFAMTPEQQAQWHADTGYFPARLSAYDLPPAVQVQDEFPQFATAVEQLRASPDTPATRGALVGPFNDVRDRVAEAFEQVLLGGADPVQELEAAADDATKIIEDYNVTAP